MNKPAPVRHPVANIIKNRWSPLAFDPRPVPPATLASLMEAVRWSPSCFNEQPWGYIVAASPDAPALSKMLGCIVDGNKPWAALAPVLMLGLAKLTFDRNGNSNAHALHDLGAASAWLTVQAESMGLRVHQMGGIEPERARGVYGVPANWQVVTGLAVGFPGTLEALPEALHARERGERSRKAMKDFVFSNAFGSAVPWAN